eukprot:1143655-Pelagomonas_calceolata.AAC.11
MVNFGIHAGPASQIPLFHQVHERVTLVSSGIHAGSFLLPDPLVGIRPRLWLARPTYAGA